MRKKVNRVRLIDADELLNKMDFAIAMMERTMKAFGIEDDAEAQMELKAYKDIRNGINDEQTVHPESNWISCKERLPEEDGEYLVTFEKGYAEDYGLDLIGIAPFEVDCDGFGIWQEHFDLQTFGSRGSDWVDIPVIAWRELPDPWRGEQE